MTINAAFEFILFIMNKEQRGSITPAQFNMLAPIAQTEVISKLLGNEHKLNERGVPMFAYKSNRKIDTILQPLMVGPELISPDSFTITGITKANPGVITFSSIGDLQNGDTIYISGVSGMTQVNGNTYVITDISGNTAQLKTTDGENVNTSAYTTYTSGGTARNGSFTYPDGMLWPDAVHKLDWSPITMADTDEYPGLKTSDLHPPTTDYPVCVFRNPKGYIDPISLSNFRMSYLAMPDDPYWAYVVTNDEAVYTTSGSVNFAIHQLGHQWICQVILQAIGINLDATQITAYAQMKEESGT
jgi:hypothetical protein